LLALPSAVVRLTLCIGISNHDHTRSNPAQGGHKKPSLLHQQLTCPPEQSLREKSFAIPEIASPRAKQSQSTTHAFEQRSELEKSSAARKTIDSILHNTSASPCSFPPFSTFTTFDKQQQHVEKTFSLPFPSLISSYLFLSSSSVSAGQKPPRVYYYYSLLITFSTPY
jgi:hypothetical protein